MYDLGRHLATRAGESRALRRFDANDTALRLQLLAVVAILGALHIPLGNYMARVYTSEKHWHVE